MLPICVRTERVWPKLPSIQGIRANLVYIVSLQNTYLWKYIASFSIYVSPNVCISVLNILPALPDSK